MKLTNSHLLNTLLILLLLLTANFGQSTKKIIGYVYDANSRLPLVGANIVIDGTGLGTTTNEFGYFQFENLLLGTYSLTASFIGYKSKTINDINTKAVLPIEVNFYLDIKQHQLDEIIITSKNNYEQFFGSIQLYTKKDIAQSNYQSVGELLQQVPGVEIHSTGGAGSSKKISIRGSQANQILVLLDGIKLNNQLGGAVDLSQIPTNIIERIEIYQGGNSPKFGSGAIGGTINIITRNQFSNKLKLNMGIGSFGYWNIEPIISGNYKNISYYLAFSKVKSLGNYPYTNQNNIPKSVNDVRINGDLQSENFFGRINYRIGKNLISVNGQKFNSERGIPGGILSLTPYARSKNSNNIFGLNYIGNFQKLNIKTNFVYSNSTTNYSNLFPDSVKPKFKRLPKYHYEYNAKNLSGDLNIIFIPNAWYKLTAGYSVIAFDYKDKNFRPTLKSPINEADDFSQAVFIHQEFKKKFDWYNFLIVFTPLLRYDIIKLNNKDLNRNENKWSPGAGVYLSIGNRNKISIKTNYSKSFRMPTFADLFYQDIRIEGKATLLPETGTNIDVTIKASTDFYGKLSTGITFFKNTIDNLIVWKLGSFEVFRPFNTDAEISGKQLEFEYSLLDNFLTFGIFHTSLTPLNKNKNITTYNKIIPYKPLNSTKVKIGVKYSNLRFNLFYRAVGKRYVTEANTIEMPPYNLVDANLSWQTQLYKLTFLWKLSVTNITNENYQIIRNYPLPLREWRLGFTISY